MWDTPSDWLLRAACSSCHQSFTLASTAVLLRRTLFGDRGIVLDALGERWPEPGRLFHPRCFALRYGRGPLWASFVRGRFDKGLAHASRWPARTPGDRSTAVDGSGWTLTVTCCGCGSPIDAPGPAVVRDVDTRRHWLWVPALQERRPGERQVSHLRCFVHTHGRSAAYAALGRDTWQRVGPLVKKVGGAITPGPS